MSLIRKSENLKNVHSDIRGELYIKALEMEAAGIPVLKLNTGNPAAFGFRMPESIRTAVTSSLDRALGYCDLRGMLPARQAILQYHLSRGLRGITENDIFIGNGVSEVVSMALTALLNRDDEVLVPSPCYSLWTNSVILASGKPVLYCCDEQAEWNPDIADIERKITPKTKAIVIINPNNPTGAVYNRETLEKLVAIAKQHNLVLFSDEIYDRLVLDNIPYTSTAAIGQDVTVITMNGLSKSHCACGFRCGWLVISGPADTAAELREALTTLAALRLCSNAIMQLAIPAALADSDYTEKMIAPDGRLSRQRQAACDELDAIDGIRYVKNSAAFYLFPRIDLSRFDFADDHAFAAGLLEEKHILTIPGSGFSWEPHDHFRIVALPQEEVLRDAVHQIGEFLEAHRR